MEITWENHEEDTIALLNHQLNTNEDYKKWKFKNIVVTPLLILAACTVYAIAKQETVAIAVGIVGAAITFLWNWCAYRLYHQRLIKNMKQNKYQKEVLCRHTALITPEGFTEKTAETSNFHTWNAIANIAFTDNYIFVYNTPITAHVIPLRELGNALFQQVREEISKYKMPRTEIGI